MPSRRSSPTKNTRRATPKLKLVRAPKGRKPVLAAKKTARPAAKPAPAQARTRKAARPVKAKPVQAKKPAPLALVPAKKPVKVSAHPAPVERVPREQLLARYTPLIKYVVERLAVGLPKNVDHEDLMSAVMLGLLDAYDKFDAKKGTKFETYAVWRIKGAVLDQLRALDWASRSIRRKAREVDASMRRLDQRLGRQASEEEIAKEAKMPLHDY